MKLQVTFETGHPATLEGLEGAVAVVYQDDRPLQGLAARADWRLNGFLSRLVVSGRFAGDRGDWLLVHTQGRLPFTHLFLVGMGPRADRTPQNSKIALEGIAGKVALAGVHSFAIELGEVVPSEVSPEDAMVVFLEALSHSYPEDELSDPPYRPAIDVRERNDERLETARRRRKELQEARLEWEAEHAAAAATAASGGLDSASLSGLDSLEPPIADAESERPIAGQLPEIEPVEEAAPVPPDPTSVRDPQLEPSPERTVHVVLTGDPGTVGAMRSSLRELSGQGDASLDVAWSK